MDGNCLPCDSFWQDQACHLQSSHSGCNVGDNPAESSHPPSFFCSGSAASASKKHVYLTECPCTQENSRVQTCTNAFCNLLHTSIRKNKEPGMADPITHEKISHLTVTLVTPVCTMMYTIIKTNYSHSSANL